MKQRILDNSSNPIELEKLYRENKSEFTKSLFELPADTDSELLEFWKIRLTPETESKSFDMTDLLLVMIFSLFSGLLVKLPELFSQIKSDDFYTRDLAIIVFNGVIMYTFWKNKVYNSSRILIYGGIITALLLFVNLLPYSKSDSVELAFIHTPLFLWCLFGLVYTGFSFRNTAGRIEFIRFNGEFLIMTGLILIAGGALTGITLGLFSAIKMNIERFYLEYVVVIGAVAAPIVSFYLIRLYPNLTSKVAPVIARVFTPLVLLTLAVYLVSLIFSQSKILEDRDLLILFNIMLLVVMAIIVFSVSELDKSKVKDFNVLVLLLLAVLAIIINAIALTAIITRLTYGLTPNRTVVLVSNILIFVNLILISKSLFQSYFKGQELQQVELTVAKYLNVYAIWTVIVIFLLPFLFNFR